MSISKERERVEPSQFTLHAGAAGWSIMADGKPLAGIYQDHLVGIVGLEDSSGLVSLEVKSLERAADHSRCSVYYRSANWTMVDNVRQIDYGLYEGVRTWTNKSDQAAEVSFRLELAAHYVPEFYLIPCVNYNGNSWGEGNEPKGLTYNGRPWTFAYDRTGIPAASFTENERYAIGLFVTDAEQDSLRSACSLEPIAEGIIHRLHWPEQEGPISYTGRDMYSEGFRHTHLIPPGGTFSVTFYVSAAAVKAANTGWFAAYDRAYSLLQRETKPVYTEDEVWSLSLTFARESLLQQDEYGTYFNIGLLPEGSHDLKGKAGMQWKLREQDRTEIGWCGQNAALARAFIAHGFRTGDNAMTTIGTDVLDTWLRNSGQQPNGLMRITLDGLWDQRPHDTADVCNLAWAAWQLIESYRLVADAGQVKLEWKHAALAICDFFVTHYDPESGFGHSWGLDGLPRSSKGTGGAFLLIPLLEAYELTGDEQYFACAKQAYSFYARRDLDRMQCTAGALDTDCIDKETGWPLFKTALDLYERTGEVHYLRDAEKAGYYLLSWCYLYDVITDEQAEFAAYQYRTYGATSVSTQHHHLDPWGALIAFDWQRLAEHTQAKQWEQLARAAWNNSLLGISDGETVIHGMKRPAGSQNEAFFASRWNFAADKETGRGSLNDWLVAWPAAFRLITIMRARERRNHFS
ncbi:hypothetical protein [Paenibacillus sp. GCM10027626]|uniref:hypothetical protein n=1 Tax=Paenibacillus sp. GCM10027626 TaxID=3273411 RepID=UPI003645AFEE